jgi:mycothiol synthase
LASTWTTRPIQSADEPAIHEIVWCSFERGDLSDWSRLDAEQLIRAAPADSEGVIVGLADGEVVGFIWPHQEQLFVHPARRRRGYGTRLIEAGLEWVRAHGEPVLALAAPQGESALPFLRARGFAYHSSLWLLRLPEAAPVAAPRFPPEFVSYTYPPGFPISRYVDLVNRSFADHPSPLTVSVELIERVHGRPTFDPTEIVLVGPTASPEQPVGFCRTKVLQDGERRVGEITLVGVLPDWRGRGLGRELLRWGVAFLRQRGVADLTLSVEARNEHALALYERTGFVRVQEWPRWAQPA